MATSSPTNTSDFVYKILPSGDWYTACQNGVYDGSVDDKRDGFIHLSAASQLQGTAEKYFKGQTDLLLVAFKAKDLEPHLKWEPSRGGALFPHYFGPLPTTHAHLTSPLPLNKAGTPILPDNL